MAVLHDVEGLRQILSGLDFPVGKDRIVEYAQDQGADRSLLSALQAMPQADYNEPNEVLRAVPQGELGGQRRSETERYQQRHPPQGMAASSRETGPVNPIEEELGENRKS
ncbi:DUF2795 domain-containing protein [Streptomonospora nanhaiensis]|uniref:DUF2795 domain-containing protein n=1 Tax=Streptomonospora nanhaiensis TaxID=1323731 RepID=A0A853BGG1_9ACTN|nr:DUF2795 domain-containing protein [Streptomonospora nanhaiensis]MBV2366768.1 DUF2795 domain-containing protein [Streptomonospora nanhaiensis]MBX9390739.1 DUF2795 domain-containing protein [Streptomonospora nanhaiensis]NYI94403.1 hypothetical protein [Streptomonospora nanhaiensis]